MTTSCILAGIISAIIFIWFVLAMCYVSARADNRLGYK